jgi:hypothetical protein
VGLSCCFLPGLGTRWSPNQGARVSALFVLNHSVACTLPHWTPRLQRREPLQFPHPKQDLYSRSTCGRLPREHCRDTGDVPRAEGQEQRVQWAGCLVLVSSLQGALSHSTALGWGRGVAFSFQLPTASVGASGGQDPLASVAGPPGCRDLPQPGKTWAQRQRPGEVMGTQATAQGTGFRRGLVGHGKLLCSA